MNRTLSLALGSALLAAAAVVPTAAAAAGGKPQSETGCFDLVDAEGHFERVISSATQSGNGSLLSPWGKVQETYYENAGVLDVSIVLAAPSCPEATYTLALYPRGTDLSGPRPPAPLRAVSVPGDGTTGTSASPFALFGLIDHLPVADDGAVCVGAQLQVSDSSGKVVDVAPDAGPADICQGGGGGRAFGG